MGKEDEGGEEGMSCNFWDSFFTTKNMDRIGNALYVMALILFILILAWALR